MFLLPDLRPEEVLIYLRKSRTDDPSLTVSETLAKHEQMLNDFCMRTWGELVPENNRFREIVSGETIEARPEIKKVLRLIEQDRYRAILIVEPQRLSRGDLEDIGRISKILRYTHTFVITLQYSYDLSDDRDRDYFERELKRGNEYLEYSKKIMHNGRNISAESGYYIGSTAPFGYRKIHVKIGKRNAPTLEIVPEEAEAVRMIFQMYADGKGCTVIANALKALGIRPKTALDWSDIVIFRILDNPHYIGMIRYNYRNEITVISDGEIRKTRKASKTSSLFKGIHPAIIDMDLWQKVRAQREKRHVPAVHSNKVLSNPLAGLIYCECGAIMIQTSVSSRKKRRLYCRHQATCGNVSVYLQDVLDAVRDSLLSALRNENVVVSEIEPQQDYGSSMLRQRIAALTRKQDALWEQLAEGMPRDTFDRLIASVTSDIEAANAALIEAESQEKIARNAESLQISLMDAISALDRTDISAAEKNKLLKACISKITYHRRKGEIFSISIELKV